MKKYEEGDWIIDKKGRSYNWAFKLDESTSLWYSNHDYATPVEIEYAVKVNILHDIRDLFGSVMKDSSRVKLSNIDNTDKLDKMWNEFVKMEDHIKYIRNKEVMSSEQYQARNLNKQWKLVTPKENIVSK